MISLMGCVEDGFADEGFEPNEIDPYIARALNDPLMVDMDLAHRDHTNAAIAIGHDHALPSFKGSAQAANRARETARLELLEEGAIANLPLAQNDAGPAILAQRYDLVSVLDALGAPSACRGPMDTNLVHAATLPEAAQLMPHGMVRVAASLERSDCMMKVARYTTPVAIEDALQYHYTKMTRDGLEPLYFTQPEASLIAQSPTTRVHIHARETYGDLVAVDVIVWTLL
jgi:hypothetical protein